jgi:hypothetical protein
MSLHSFIPHDLESELLDTISFLLALGLSRNIFKHYKDAQSLFKDDRLNLIIDPENENEPLLITEESMDKMQRQAISVGNLYNFFKSRWVKVGLPGMHHLS